MSCAGQITLTDAIVTADTPGEAVETLVREHARFVYKVAYSVLRNHHDAEDATQETFIRVMRHAAKVAQMPDQRPWLARVAWRIAVDRIRQRGTQPLDDAAQTLEQLRSAGPGAEQVVIGQQMVSLLERLVERLPREFRDVVALSTVQEMTSAEIAQVLQIPEATVRTRLLRARRLLREKMQALMEGHYEA